MKLTKDSELNSFNLLFSRIADKEKIRNDLSSEVFAAKFIPEKNTFKNPIIDIFYSFSQDKFLIKPISGDTFLCARINLNQMKRSSYIQEKISKVSTESTIYIDFEYISKSIYKKINKRIKDVNQFLLNGKTYHYIDYKVIHFDHFVEHYRKNLFLFGIYPIDLLFDKKSLFTFLREDFTGFFRDSFIKEIDSKINSYQNVNEIDINNIVDQLLSEFVETKNIIKDRAFYSKNTDINLLRILITFFIEESVKNQFY